MVVSLLLALLIGTAQAGASAEDLVRSGRLGDALPAAQLEAAQGPVEARARYLDLLHALQFNEMAVQEARGWVQAAPLDADAHYLLGRALPTAEEATRSYEAALRIDPDHARSHMGMGAVHRALERADEAVAAYRRALALSPGLGEAWAGLVYAELQAGRPEKAIEAAREAITAAPDEPEAWLLVAVLVPDEAVDVLTRGERAVPGDPRLPALLAEAWLSRGDGTRAGAAAARALAIDPGHAEALRSALFAQAMRAGNLDADGWKALVDLQAIEHVEARQALTGYAELIERYPNTPLPRMSRARVLAQQGDLAGARADLEQALALQSDNIEARAAYGLLLHRLGEHAQARPHLEAAAAARPRDASLAVTAGQAAAAAGDTDEGLRRLRQALQTFPLDARVPLALAQVQAEAGENEAAYAVLRQAVGRIPDSRLVLALAAAARDTGRWREAADILDDIGQQTGHAGFREAAARLRAQGAAEGRDGP